jgi:hypothetical protein
MRKYPILIAACVLLAGVACQRPQNGTPLGTIYEQIARPAIWRVLAHTQAESLGLQPGDVLMSYKDEPLKTVDDLRRLMAGANGAAVPLTVLRGEEEVKLTARPGPLGILLDIERYQGSLAVALKDMLAYFGTTADYDWLAALTGESFTFTARKGLCAGHWPDGLSGEYMDGVEKAYGLRCKSVFQNEATDSAGAVEAARQARETIAELLSRDRVTLVLGGWPGTNGDMWGVATRYEPADSSVYGYTLGSSGEVRLTGTVQEAYDVAYRPLPEPEPDEMLTVVLTEALELGQAYADSGWQSGIAAYDVWIAALDTVPFCRVCGDSSQMCFDRLVWTDLANKESANRFMNDMREAIPDQTELMDDILADNTTIASKLMGIIQSRVKVGAADSQQKLARAISEIQIIESDLLGLYEDLIGEL